MSPSCWSTLPPEPNQARPLCANDGHAFDEHEHDHAGDQHQHRAGERAEHPLGAPVATTARAERLRTRPERRRARRLGCHASRAVTTSAAPSSGRRSCAPCGDLIHLIQRRGGALRLAAGDEPEVTDAAVLARTSRCAGVHADALVGDRVQPAGEVEVDVADRVRVRARSPAARGRSRASGWRSARSRRSWPMKMFWNASCVPEAGLRTIRSIGPDALRAGHLAPAADPAGEDRLDLVLGQVRDRVGRVGRDADAVARDAVEDEAARVARAAGRARTCRASRGRARRRRCRCRSRPGGA